MGLIGICILVMAIFPLAELSDEKYMEGYSERDCWNELSCPSWSYCNENSTCKCYERNYVVLCSENGDKGGVLECYCLTWNEDRNETEEGNCLYNCNIYNRNYFSLNGVYTTLPRNLTDLNAQMCGGLNRTGTLCSECVDGMYMRAYSYDMSCTTCSGGWINILKYILVAFVPLTILYLVVLLFSINIPSSKLQGIVLVSQMATSPMLIRVFVIDLKLQKSKFMYRVLQVFGTVFGIWNLDFFRLLDLDICFKTSPLLVLSLDFLVALYPFGLILLTHLAMLLHNYNFTLVRALCKRPYNLITKCCRKSWDLKTSTIDAFVTFMLLSYVKIYNVCLDILVPVMIYSKYHKNRYGLYMNASLNYFSPHHLWYAIPSIMIGLLFIICPVIILLLYPYSCFQRCLSILPYRWQILFHVIVDSVQGCYKNGTEPGTRDCRWFSAIPFAIRFVFSAVCAISVNTASLPYIAQVFVLLVIVTIIADPYKDIFKQMTRDFSISLLFLANLYMIIVGMDYSFISIASNDFHFGIIMALAPLPGGIYMLAYAVKWIIAHKKC